MSLRDIFAFGLCLIALAGCAAMFERPPEGADYGPAPVGYEAAVRAYLDDKLPGPGRYEYVIQNPVKGYQTEGLAYGGYVNWFGWLVSVQVIPYDAFGSLRHGTAYMVFFSNDLPVKHLRSGFFDGDPAANRVYLSLEK